MTLDLDTTSTEPPASGEGRTAARVIALGVLGALTVAGASGLTARLAFSDPSSLKYGLSVVVPLLGIALLHLERIDLALVVLTVVGAPFSFLSVGVGGLQLTAIDVLLVASVVAISMVRPVVKPASQLSFMAVVTSLLLLALVVPLIGASDKYTVLHLVVVAVLLSRVVAVTARVHGARPVALAFVAGATVQSLLALLEFSRGAPINFYATGGSGAYGSDYFFQYGDVFRPAAAFPDPISLGNVLALTCPLLIVCFSKSRGPIERLLLSVAALMVGLALIATLSRQSWLAAVVGVLLAILLSPRGQRLKRTVGVAVSLFVVLAVAVAVAGPDVTTRLQSIEDPTGASVSTAAGDEARLQLQRTALRVGLAHQPFGVGLGNLPDYLIASVPDATASSHAHNTYLNVFAETGITGLAGLLLVVGAAFSRSLRSALRSRTGFASGVTGSLLATLIVWATDYTVRYIAVAAMIAIVLGLASASSAEKVGEAGGP